MLHNICFNANQHTRPLYCIIFCHRSVARGSTRPIMSVNKSVVIVNKSVVIVKKSVVMSPNPVYEKSHPIFILKTRVKFKSLS